ncbi:hypothetical protein BDB01DRAFT_800021 [Pilobolus umbonatus]|nr:hypothetical protein BDB01DRAFT_800021 [Pilobolus umbonatus]
MNTIADNYLSTQPVDAVYNIVNTMQTVPDLLPENSSISGQSSTEEAAFPPTYASLPTTKLEEEPNPFEESFEVATIKEVPPATSVDKEWTIGIRRPTKYEVNTTFYNHTFDNPPSGKQTRSRKLSSTSSEGQNKRRKEKKEPEDEDKRKNFLERNRIAALKCRQRKKQWLQNLQTKVEYLAADNEQFHMQANALKEEVINLKNLLMIHRDCHINQPALKEALNRPIPGVSSHLVNGYNHLL